MILIDLILFFLLFVISYRLTRSFIHPAVVTNILWFFLITLYNTVDHGLYVLSERFYYALFLWVVPFSFISIMFTQFPVQYPKKLSGDINKLPRYLYPFVFLSLIIAIYGLYTKGIYYNSDNFLAGVRAAGVASLNGETENYIAPLYINLSQGIAGFSLIMLLVLLFKPKNKFIFSLFTLLVITFFLFRSNKSVIAQLMFALLIMCAIERKISKKQIFLFLFIFVGVMLFAHLSRGHKIADFDFIQFLSIYLLAPLPSFDAILNSHYDYISSFNGEYTFRFFVPYMQMLGINVEGNPDPFNLNNWTYTPLPINVYTIMFSFYVDYGFAGIAFFSAVLGAFFGYLYRFAKIGLPLFKVLYANFFYIIVFQFFSDNSFLFLGSMISTILFASILYLHISNVKKTAC